MKGGSISAGCSRIMVMCSAIELVETILTTGQNLNHACDLVIAAVATCCTDSTAHHPLITYASMPYMSMAYLLLYSRRVTSLSIACQTLTRVLSPLVSFFEAVFYKQNFVAVVKV